MTETVYISSQVTELDSGVGTDATATAVVTVSVSDINDNVPTFSNTSYTVSVSESDNQLASNNVQIPDLDIQVTDLDDVSSSQWIALERAENEAKIDWCQMFLWINLLLFYKMRRPFFESETAPEVSTYVKLI